MRKIYISALSCILFSIIYAGGPGDHAIWSFQDLNKPTKDITLVDHANAIIKHAFIDGAVAENGSHLIAYQSAVLLIAYEKAKSIGMGPQFKMAARDGNLFDSIDKGITGGAIQYQLAQIPFIGEHLSMIVPHLASHEILHAIPGYPQPSYSMTEGQYFWFQFCEVALFWFECDYIKVMNNRIYGEIKF